MDLKGKKVLIYGTGKSGIGAAVLLEKVQARPVLFDENEKLALADVKAKLPADSCADVILGKLKDEDLRQIDMCILSPGVPTDLPLVDKIRGMGIKVWGEVELAYEYSKGDVLAITGTNGKTTTTSLLGDIMKHCQPSAYVVGNIGNPYTDIALETKEDTVIVAEISSFQLETIEKFRPKVSAILNITPDHLNRHHTMEEYIRVKECITANQTEEDTCILNYEDGILREFGKKVKAEVIFFSSLRTLEKGLYLKDGCILYNSGKEETAVCRTSELNIPGRHNHENVMAAVGMALAYGVPLAKIRDAAKQFKAVEHRIEFVKDKDGVVYYNDSKGTNPDAAIKGIQAMDRPTFLIGGGYDKGSCYEEWIRAFDGKVRRLVLIGETKEKIAEAALKCGFTGIISAETLEEAVNICAREARGGDAVLLSPACASWDMFPSYEVRGQMFKEYVRNL